MKFEDVTERAGLAGSGYDFGAAVGDFNKDGRPDLFVTGLRHVTLYRNNPDGTFTDVTGEARLDNRGRWSVAAAWVDMDNDADEDLFVVNYVAWDPQKERQCLVNTADLYITNDRVFSFLFLNRGNGKFEEAAFAWGVAVPESGNPVSGMGTDAQDFDNDGRPDLIVTALRDETFPLFRNTGRELTEVTSGSRMGVLSRRMSGWGAAFADLDNDGWKDVVVACSDALSPTGGRGAAVMEQPAWFRNMGDGKFGAGVGWENVPREMYRGLITADFDGDGCLDVLLTALNAEARMLRNPCDFSRNWLKVDARIPGTRVSVGNQWRSVTGAVGYASSYAGPLHFGLGELSVVSVEAVFPDGRRKKVQTPANRTIKLEP
jgi:hypothetical protein